MDVSHPASSATQSCAPEAQAVRPSKHDRAWAAYCAARLVALGAPFDEAEGAALARAEAALRRSIGLEPAPAAYQARRCLLFRREHLIHESFVLDMDLRRMPQILDSVAVIGLEHLLSVDQGRGLLLVSLHYSLYSSVLVQWLARAAARGVLGRRLTVLLRSGYTGYGLPPEGRLEAAERAGLLSRASFALLDRTPSGPAAAARSLAAELRGGNAVLLFPDARFVPQSDKALVVSVGRQTVGLPRGAAWLVQAVRCPVLPVHLRPDGEDRHAIVFGPALDPATGLDPRSLVEAALQHLVQDAVLVDPGPWEGWLRDWSAQAATGA